MVLNMKLKDKVNITGQVTLEFTNVVTGKKRTYRYKNMFVTYGKNGIAQRLAGQSVGEITYCALGTGTTAPALSDTAMETELTRKLISVRSYLNNTATFQTYFTTSEGNGTLREAGLFGNGVGRTATSTSGTGQLFCRVAINRTKTSSDTLTLSWVLTIG